MLDPSLTGIGPGYGHGGDYWGYFSYAFYFPDRDIVIAGIVNLDNGDANRILVNALQTIVL